MSQLISYTQKYAIIIIQFLQGNYAAHTPTSKLIKPKGEKCAECQMFQKHFTNQHTHTHTQMKIEFPTTVGESVMWTVNYVDCVGGVGCVCWPASHIALEIVSVAI